MTLDEIRQLINEATPGPWEWEQDQLIGYEPFTDSSKGRGFAQTIIETDNGVYGPEEKDRRFIAAARTLLPALLEVAEAAQKFMHLYTECDMNWPGVSDQMNDWSDLLAERLAALTGRND